MLLYTSTKVVLKGSKVHLKVIKVVLKSTSSSLRVVEQL
jgi:hypothetical protein